MFAHSTSVSIRNAHTTLVPCYGTSGAISSRHDEDDDGHRARRRHVGLLRNAPRELELLDLS